MSRDTQVPPSGGTRPSSGVDREAWAAEVRLLIGAEAGGNLSAFARLIGIDRRSVTRWLGKTVDVSEATVRQVARSLNLPVGDLLTKVGLLDQGDLTSQPPVKSMDSEAVKAIDASDAQPDVKRKLFAHLRDAREQHERQRFTEIQRMLGFLVGSQR